MTNTDNITKVFFELFDAQSFVGDELDYSILESHKPKLQMLSDIGNSLITVLDVYQKRHVFQSENFATVLGYNERDVAQYGEHFMNAKIHPDDFWGITKNGLTGFKLFLKMSENEKLNFKFINEFRVLNASGQYVRIIEQHQALELDNRGNLWLALSILDISPDQDLGKGLKSQLLNFRTGEFIPLLSDDSDIKVQLTQRETEILKLVKEGLLSKEISDRLSISIHTVNTHRQRVLEKLGANNSMEAVVLSSRLGLV